MTKNVIHTVNRPECLLADRFREVYDWIRFTKKDLEDNDLIAANIAWLRAKASMDYLEEFMEQSND